MTEKGAADLMGRARWRPLVIWLVTVASVIVLPFVFSSGSSISLMSQVGVFIIFALSYNMLLGQTGLLSFGHAVYFGIGGFAALHVIHAVQTGWLWWPLEWVPLAGGLAGLLLAVILGSFATRRGGVTFAMITLGLGALVTTAAHILTGFFGGQSGLSANRVTGVTLLPFSYGPGIQVYYLIGVWMLLSTLAMYLLGRTPLGRMANAVRDNPRRAQFIGYSTTMVRFLQFALSGFFAGIAGALFAIQFEIMTAANLGLEQSGAVLLMTYIGGIGVFFGPIIGAMLVTCLKTVLSQYAEGWLLYFGLLFVVMVTVAPGGIAGIITAHSGLWRAGLLRRLVPVYALASVPAVLTLAGGVSLVEMGYQLSLAWNPSRPIELLYVSVNVTQVQPWIVAMIVLGVGAGMLGWTVTVIRRRWAQVSQLMQAREPAS